MSQSLKNPTTANFVQKTLGATFNAGANVMTLNNVTSIQNLPGVAIVDRIDTNNIETPTKREVVSFTGTSGVTTVGVVKNADGSGTDQTHAVGAIVEFGPDILWAQSVIDGLTQVIDPTTGLVDLTKIPDLSSAQTLSHKTLSAPNLVVGSDTTGDIYFRGNGASLSRLPLGNLNEVITANASLPAYKPVANRSPFVTLTDATTNYLDFSVGHKWITTIVPDGNPRNYFATNATLGYVGMLRIKFASTVSLAINLLTTGATISWFGGSAPTPTNTAGKVDMFGFVCSDTFPTFDGAIIGQNR